MVGRPLADALRILYGGSVKPENAEALPANLRSMAPWLGAPALIPIRSFDRQSW